MVTFKPVRSLPRGLGGGHSGEIVASYADLRAILGVPRTAPKAHESQKVSTEWFVKGSDGSYFTVYDYKATNRYSFTLPGVRKFRSLPTYQWCIGYVGGRGCNASVFVDWLKARIEALHAPAVPIVDDCSGPNDINYYI
jgi:hypothetical protein